MTTYLNVPTSGQRDNFTLRAFDTYYSDPIEINAGTLDATMSFFSSRGFDSTAAESVAMLILTQAKKDGYNPLQILDTLKGLSEVELSALVAEIINYNRFKTSFLGYALDFKPNQEVARNVIA